MKKLLAASLFILLGTSAFSQASQETIVVSGNLGINSSSVEHDNNSNDDTKTRNFL